MTYNIRASQKSPNSTILLSKVFNQDSIQWTQSFVMQDPSLVGQKATDHYLLQIPTVYLTRAGQPPDTI